jgi:hypothetical protein
MAGTLQTTGRTFHGVEKLLRYELLIDLQSNDLGDNTIDIFRNSAFLGLELIFAMYLIDINKEGNHIFEYMGKVHDGSENSDVDGYIAVLIEGIQKKGDHLPFIHRDVFIKS